MPLEVAGRARTSMRRILPAGGKVARRQTVPRVVRGHRPRTHTGTGQPPSSVLTGVDAAPCKFLVGYGPTAARVDLLRPQGAYGQPPESLPKLRLWAGTPALAARSLRLFDTDKNGRLRRWPYKPSRILRAFTGASQTDSADRGVSVERWAGLPARRAQGVASPRHALHSSDAGVDRDQVSPLRRRSGAQPASGALVTF